MMILGPILVMFYHTFLLVSSQHKGVKVETFPSDHKYRSEFNKIDGDGLIDEDIVSDKYTCNEEQCGGMELSEVRNHFAGLFHTRSELENVVQTSQLLRRDRMKERVKVRIEKEFQDVQRQPTESDIDDRITEEVDLDVGHDWDQCCATKHSFTMSNILTNMNNQPRTIVHLKNLQPQPMYQLVPVGECVSGHGRCGTCVMEKVIRFLLVIDPTSTNVPPFTFDAFEIDMYCSCKSL